MRSYIFTEIEKKLIDTYFNKGIKVQDFFVLLNRINRNYPRLKEDMTLLEKIVEKESQ